MNVAKTAHDLAPREIKRLSRRALRPIEYTALVFLTIALLPGVATVIDGVQTGKPLATCLLAAACLTTGGLAVFSPVMIYYVVARRQVARTLAYARAIVPRFERAMQISRGEVYVYISFEDEHGAVRTGHVVAHRAVAAFKDAQLQRGWVTHPGVGQNLIVEWKNSVLLGYTS